MTRSSFKAIQSGCYLLFFSIIFLYLVRVLTLTSYGIDFSDEGRHLNEIKNASSYSWAASQYGSVIHPIAEFFDYNVSYLRILNLTITFLLSFWVFRIQFRKSNFLGSQGKFYSLLCSSAFGLLGITFFNVWLPTPSYYSMTFQSLMLFWISFKLLNIEVVSILKLPSIILLSFSSSIVFLSKPTAFFVAWVISMLSIWLYTSNKVKYSVQYNIVLLLFLLAASLMYFGNPLSLFKRILMASRLMGIQDPAYKIENVFRLDFFPFPWQLLLLLYVFTALIGSIVIFRNKPWFRHNPIIATILIFSLVVVAYFFVSNFNFDSNPIILLITPFFLGLNIILLGSQRVFLQRTFILNLFLILLPLAYALGTNGNLWIASTQSIFFIVLFAWWLISESELEKIVKPSQILILVLSIPLSIYTIEYGIANPYRQSESIHLQQATAALDKNINGVRLSDGIRNSFDVIYKSADRIDLPLGGPIIDLTGQSPLTIFALKAYPVGSPWMVGGYAGSNALAKEVLKDVECRTLTKSWLLIEPRGPRSLDVDKVLGALGLSLKNYSLAASWNTPIGAGGYSESRLQKLYRPLNDVAGSRKQGCRLFQAN